MTIRTLRRLAIVAELFTAVGLGCMCWSPKTTCEVNSDTPVVFLGRVTQVTVSGSPENPVMRVRVVVLESFRGIADREAELTTSATSCGVSFKQDSEYLIYASRQGLGGQLGTGACSGTDLAVRSKESIEQLRGIKTGRGKSRIFGFVTGAPTDLQSPYRAKIPLAGVRVELANADGTQKTVTDSRGEYEFSDLTGGTYNLLADVPSPVPRKVTVIAGACGRQNLVGVVVGRITGRLVTAGGAPVPNTFLKLDAVPPTPAYRPATVPRTDAAGHFSFESLPMGTYQLGVNVDRPPNHRDWHGTRHPFARAFYSGAATREQATVLKLEAGHNIEDLEFQLLPTPATRLILGKVVMPNGEPAQAMVSLLDLEYPSDSAQVDSVQAKEDGSFALAGFEGRPYALFSLWVRDKRVQRSEIVKLSPTSAETLRIVLAYDESFYECKVCDQYRVWLSPLW